MQIEARLREPKPVAGRAPLDPDPVVAGENPAKARDVRLESVACGRWWFFPPNVLDQVVNRDRGVEPKQEGSEHGALARASERLCVSVCADHLERAKHSELHEYLPLSRSS